MPLKHTRHICSHLGSQQLLAYHVSASPKKLLYKKLFTVENVISCIHVFSVTPAKEILSIVNEVFDDIDGTMLLDTDSNNCKDEKFTLNDLLLNEFSDTALPQNHLVMIFLSN